MGFKYRPSKAKEIEKKHASYRRDRFQASIASDIKRREIMENYQPNDLKLFHLGEDWFNSGMKLEDAPDGLEKNKKFIDGFNRAKRIRDIEEYQYNLGAELFENGIPLEQILEKYEDKPFVIKGFEDAKNNAKHK